MVMPTIDIKSPCPNAFNLAAYVLNLAQSAPEKPALLVTGVDGTEEWTYAALERAVLGTARGLSEAGLRSGDRVLMRLGNSALFPIVYLGAIAGGFIPIPTSSQLTEREITAISEEISPQVIATEVGIPCPQSFVPVLNREDLLGFQKLAPASYQFGDPHRPAYIVYTSGTSGRPRPVVHAHRAIWARRMMFDAWYGLTEKDRLLHAGAFNWTYTLGTGLMDPWAIGATSIVPAPDTATSELPTLLKNHSATIFAAAPGVYRRLLREELPELPALRHGLSAGEKLPEVTRKRWQKATGTEIFEAYGMSECSTFVSASPNRPAPPGTLGFIQPGRKVAIRKGVLAVHKTEPGLMLGYDNSPEETASKFDGDWFLTGDQVEEDATGAIRFLGRSDDMMNAGGYRVSPVEVEDAMTQHPDIEEAAACEIQVKADATVVALFYTSRKTLDHAALASFAQKRLARYKMPRLFKRVDALPRGANNKLLRNTLKNEWETKHG